MSSRPEIGCCGSHGKLCCIVAALEHDIKQEVSLCPARHNEVVLGWVACKSDHKTDEVLMAYTAEVHKKGES